MKLCVRYSAQLRAALGQAEADVELPPGSTLEKLLAHLAGESPEAAPHLVTDSGQPRPSLLMVVNDAAVSAREAAAIELHAGDTITLLPPIAGG